MQQTNEDMSIIGCLSFSQKLASSKREAREFVKGGSIMINGHKVTDENFIVSKENAFGQKATVIRRGKKKYCVLKHI